MHSMTVDEPNVTLASEFACCWRRGNRPNRTANEADEVKRSCTALDCPWLILPPSACRCSAIQLLSPSIFLCPPLVLSPTGRDRRAARCDDWSHETAKDDADHRVASCIDRCRSPSSIITTSRMREEEGWTIRHHRIKLTGEWMEQARSTLGLH